MKKSDFVRLDASLVVYSEARAKFNAAQQALWSSIIPFVVEAITSASRKRDFVPRSEIIEYVDAKVLAYYQSEDMKSTLPHGRLTHDGQLVYAVDTNQTLVEGAIKWAVICEVIVEVVDGQYALPEPKRA